MERNPVRARMVRRAGDDVRSRAVAHITGQDRCGLLDMEWWRREAHADWQNLLDESPRQPDEALRAATYAGRPFGSDEFLRQTAEQFDRHWTCGRPKKKPPARPDPEPTTQFSLF